MTFYPLRPKCSECHADCHPHESETNFAQWEECEMCRDCAESLSASEQNEFRSMPR